jgi:hypothetical protein
MEYLTDIQNLLELIERANKAIAFHLQATEPDKNSIENYERLKMGYYEQLAEIFSKMNIPLKLSA